MQASQDDGGDFELGHLSPREHTTTTVRGGPCGQSKESVVTDGYDGGLGARHEADSQMEGIRVTRVTKVSVE